jgi:hypothetical protein
MTSKAVTTCDLIFSSLASIPANALCNSVSPHRRIAIHAKQFCPSHRIAMFCLRRPRWIDSFHLFSFLPLVVCLSCLPVLLLLSQRRFCRPLFGRFENLNLAAASPSCICEILRATGALTGVTKGRVANVAACCFVAAGMHLKGGVRLGT